MGICPKENAIARLKFELAYYNSIAQCFNHYTMKTPPTDQNKCSKNCLLCFFISTEDRPHNKQQTKFAIDFEILCFFFILLDIIVDYKIN